MRNALIACLAVGLAACSSGGRDASSSIPDGGIGTASRGDAKAGSSETGPGTSGKDGGRAPDREGGQGAPGDASAPSDSANPERDGGVVQSGADMFGGCPLFAPSYAYNVDISQSAVDPSSAGYIASLTALAPTIVAEFPGLEYYNLVPATQPFVPVGTASVYGFQPDGGFFYGAGADVADASAPIPPGVLYEDSNTPNSDHHLIVLQQGTCTLYELYSWNPTSATSGWDCIVEWDLHGSPQIPAPLDIGSTTQAGTPLLPGVIWPVEVASGEIHHALDIVLADNAITPCAYVHPASTVRYSGAPDGGGVPYGVRLRLKSTYDTSGYTGTQALVVIRALQKYGMIPTDASGETRSTFRLGLSPDGGTLDGADMGQLNQLTWNDFEVMPVGPVSTVSDCTP